MKIKNISQVVVLVFLLTLTFFLVSVSAIPSNLTSEVGSSYINWSWNNSDHTPISLYVDGSFVTNTTLDSFILSGLGAREYHSITLINQTNITDIYGANSARTFYSLNLFYVFVTIMVGCLLLSILVKNEILSLLLGVFTIFLSLFTYYMSYPYHLSLMAYLSLVVLVITIFWLFINVSIILADERREREEDLLKV